MTVAKLRVLVAPDLYSEVPLPSFDPDDTSWEPLAACKPYLQSCEGSPWTDPKDSNEKRIAERICWLECEVRQHCLTAGQLPAWEPMGIYGGRNPNQRRLLKKHWRETGQIPDVPDEQMESFDPDDC